MIAPTPAQHKAIAATGNILVVAGAGTGKTRTLVQRCLAWLLDEKNAGSLDQILMVTFTEAAAAEMRRRLREELEKIYLASGDARWAEQLALLDTARICTLHSFCLQLVRPHFHELSLDPELAVLADEQSQLLARETLGEILDQHYRGETSIAAAVQELIQQEGRGWDQPVRDLVARVHNYTQTLRDPAAWFEAQLKYFKNPTPQDWEKWLLDELREWRDSWRPILEAQPAENFNARQCADTLKNLSVKSSRENFSAGLGRVREIDERDEWPKGKKTILRAPMKKFFEDAEFLYSLCDSAAKTDPLAEDWNWVRPQMLALLQLVQEFDRNYSNAKRQLGGIDFHDFEQFTLDLLWDRKTNLPTLLAQELRKKIRLIFVDEYQDINAAQDAIIQALGGDGDAANRFLVGDVKQSIYRFRLANPKIFLGYQSEWIATGAQTARPRVGKIIPDEPKSLANDDARTGRSRSEVIPLSDNFRSHEAILNFVNPLFTALMRKELGGVDYDDDAKLQFGNRPGRGTLTVAADASTRVELHLRLTEDDGEAEEESSDWQSLSSAEKEARFVATHLRHLKDSSTLVWDKADGKEMQRPAKWSDMVILLRSPRKKAEAYAKEFARLGVPLTAPRGGFYESLEVTDLLNLLRLLDNPLQDLPLLAVLRSPLVGLSANELATIRIASRKGKFWTALVCWNENEKLTHTNSESSANPPSAIRNPQFKKVEKFLNAFARWRRLLRQISLSHLLEMVLDETHYGDWLLAQERGGQRRANVERLLQLTRQFDTLQGEGLFRFLKFVEAQQESEIDVEPAAAEGADAVRLMSIHQSKGLEFPIVVVADLAKPFNFSDANGNVILDEEFGLCPRVRPPHTQQRYPSLPHWLAQRRQKRETLGEELRLLYVALTRASERLILIGTTRRKTVEEKWPESVAGGFGLAQISNGKNFLEWMGGWLVHENGKEALAASGKNSLLSWTIHEGEVLDSPETPGEPAAPVAGINATPEDLENLRARLEWRYANEAATLEPAKTSVSMLRRRARDESDDEARELFAANVQRATFNLQRSKSAAAGKLSAAEVGSAHHTFLELVSLARVGTAEMLRGEAQRLHEEKALSVEEIAALDFAALAAFWESEVAKKILEERDNVRRELAFTARFSAADLAKLNLAASGKNLADEFVVVQGVIDLAVILPREIWLLDFKTDHFEGSQLAEKTKFYESQLALYAEAISRIYGRPVTQRWLHFLAMGKTVPIS